MSFTEGGSLCWHYYKHQGLWCARLVTRLGPAPRGPRDPELSEVLFGEDILIVEDSTLEEYVQDDDEEPETTVPHVDNTRDTNDA
jgi:hypothetical protein